MAENGFLTDRDRKFLRGEKEYTGKNAKQMRYEVRRAIRERTRAAFRDFTLLNQTIDAEERGKIINVPPRIDGPPYSDYGLNDDTREGIIDTLAFLYLAVEGELDALPPHELPTVPSFEQLIESAVSRAEFDRRANAGLNSVTSVEFSTQTFEQYDVANAATKLARGDAASLNEAELRALVQEGADYIDGHGIEPLLAEKVDQIREQTAPRQEVPEWFEDGDIDEELRPRDEPLSKREQVEMIIRLDRTGHSIDEILDIVDL